MINKLLFSSTTIDSLAASVGLAGLRISTGLSTAFSHGAGKNPPSEVFTKRIADMGFPAPNWFAWAARLSEFGGELLIALGLMTRPASFFLGVTIFVAAFIRHAADPFMRKEKALPFLALAVFFTLVGAGRYSLDRIIRPSWTSYSKQGPPNTISPIGIPESR